MKNNYKNLIPSSKPSPKALDKDQPRVLARQLSLEATQLISAGAAGDLVCTGTQKGDKVRLDCVYY